MKELQQCQECFGYIDSSCCCKLTSKIYEKLLDLNIDPTSIIITAIHYDYGDSENVFYENSITTKFQTITELFNE